jgi:hypothetical protein
MSSRMSVTNSGSARYSDLPDRVYSQPSSPARPQPPVPIGLTPTSPCPFVPTSSCSAASGLNFTSAPDYYSRCVLAPHLRVGHASLSLSAFACLKCIPPWSLAFQNHLVQEHVQLGLNKLIPDAPTGYVVPVQRITEVASGRRSCPCAPAKLLRPCCSFRFSFVRVTSCFVTI